LRNTYAAATEYFERPQIQGARGLLDADWDLFTETAARLAFGWSDEERAKQAVNFFRESSTQEIAKAAYDDFIENDVSDLLEKIAMPTLVVYVEAYQHTTSDPGRGLAAAVPGARLAVVQNFEDYVPLVDEFLNEGSEAKPTKAASGFATILFTDMEGSTTLADRLGDAAAQEVRRTHNDVVRAALREHSGSEIKHTGDGIMASFATASAGLDAAIAIQRGVAQHKEEQPDSPLAVYVGLNAGEPIAEEDDLFGTSINLAARICDHAEAGQILAANVVRELAAGKDFLFSDLGETELRGFEDPVKLWELRWQDS
jgi:class 3 adenylate cyclase